MWAPAVRTSAGGTSGGVAVIAHEALGLSLPQGSSTGAIVPGRLVAALVEAPDFRPMVCFSAYMAVNQGLSRGNLEILAALGDAATRHAAYFLAGGDWNMGSQMLRYTSFIERTGGAFFDTGGVPTCVTSKSSSVIDFFVGSKELMHVVDKVSVCKSSRMAPHRPVTL